jgi:hypothetical protein
MAARQWLITLTVLSVLASVATCGVGVMLVLERSQPRQWGVLVLLLSLLATAAALHALRWFGRGARPSGITASVVAILAGLAAVVTYLGR